MADVEVAAVLNAAQQVVVGDLPHELEPVLAAVGKRRREGRKEGRKEGMKEGRKESRSVRKEPMVALFS